METKDKPIFEQFVAQCRDSFAFLSKFGFSETALPEGKFVNRFQVRFSNGTLIVVIKGINWGQAAEVELEDAAGVTVPLVLFVPREQRSSLPARLAGEPEQCFEIRAAAYQLNNYCLDLLGGDMTRFYDRSAEWQRIIGEDRSYQKRVLPA